MSISCYFQIGGMGNDETRKRRDRGSGKSIRFICLVANPSTGLDILLFGD